MAGIAHGSSGLTHLLYALDALRGQVNSFGTKTSVYSKEDQCCL